MKEVIIKYFGDKIENHEIVEEVGELIRCKDCKHKTKCFSEVVMTNKHQTADIYESVEWCSLGERETE